MMFNGDHMRLAFPFSDQPGTRLHTEVGGVGAIELRPISTREGADLTTSQVAQATRFPLLDFVSQNWEIERAIRITHALFPHVPVRLVGDSGLDDQQFFQLLMRLPNTHCSFRAQHKRHVEVYNERLDRSSHERLFEVAACTYLPVALQTTFTHARKQRQVTVQAVDREPRPARRRDAQRAHHPEHDDRAQQDERHDARASREVPVGARPGDCEHRGHAGMPS